MPRLQSADRLHASWQSSYEDSRGGLKHFRAQFSYITRFKNAYKG